MPRVSVSELSGYAPKRLNGKYRVRCNGTKLIGEGRSMILSVEVISGPPFESGAPCEGTTVDKFITLNVGSINNEWVKDRAIDELAATIEAFDVKSSDGDFDTDAFVGKEATAVIKYRADYQGILGNQIVQFQA